MTTYFGGQSGHLPGCWSVSCHSSRFHSNTSSMFSELKDRLLRCIAFSLRRPVQIKLISFYLIKLQIKSIALLTMVENWFKVIVKVEFFFLWRWISAWALAKLALRLPNSSADFARTGKWALNLHHENIIIFSSLKSFDLLFGYENIFRLYLMVLPRVIYIRVSLNLDSPAGQQYSYGEDDFHHSVQYNELRENHCLTIP